jgi:hypothetical protein
VEEEEEGAALQVEEGEEEGEGEGGPSRATPPSPSGVIPAVTTRGPDGSVQYFDAEGNQLKRPRGRPRKDGSWPSPSKASLRKASPSKPRPPARVQVDQVRDDELLAMQLHRQLNGGRHGRAETRLKQPTHVGGGGSSSGGSGSGTSSNSGWASPQHAAARSSTGGGVTPLPPPLLSPPLPLPLRLLPAAAAAAVSGVTPASPHRPSGPHQAARKSTGGGRTFNAHLTHPQVRCSSLLHR